MDMKNIIVHRDRHCYFCFLALLVVCLSGCKKQIGQSDQDKPNIVFLFADDLSYEALGCYGNPIIKTPNLDRLANLGVRFTHAYNMGGWHGAICVASRSMIVSGQTIWRAEEEATNWENNVAESIANTWPMLMQKAGYATYMSGKWHISAPNEEVFNTAQHLQPGGMPYDHWILNPEKKDIPQDIREAVSNNTSLKAVMPIGYHRPMDEDDQSWLATDSSQPGYWKGGKHWSEVLKDDALEFIQTASIGSQPYFMYLAFNAPHDPRQAPQSYVDLYDVDSIPLPDNWLPEYPYKDDIGNYVWLRDEALAPYPRSPFAIKTHISEYYAIITHLDHQIGQILDALESAGQLDNTYVFFTGDHGLSVGHHGLMGKQSLFDHSIRVPLIIAGPNINPGEVIESEVYLQDIMPTSLELARIEKPEHVEFNSLLDLSQGHANQGHYQDGIYGAYRDLQRMIRKDDYKLLVYPTINKVLLFDMSNDPLETNDLSSDPAHKAKVKSLFSDLIGLQKQMNDPLDLRHIYENL